MKRVSCNVLIPCNAIMLWMEYNACNRIFPISFMQHVSSKNVEKHFPNIFTLGLPMRTSSFYVDLVEISIMLMLRWWRKGFSQF